MEASFYSEITSDGLKFLKEDIMITKDGLTNLNGESYASIPMSKDNI